MLKMHGALSVFAVALPCRCALRRRFSRTALPLELSVAADLTKRYNRGKYRAESNIRSSFIGGDSQCFWSKVQGFRFLNGEGTVINEPVPVVCDSFQLAWLEVVRRLGVSSWDLRNVIVHIRQPGLMDNGFHRAVTAFAHANGLLSPKQVAYTIFPHKLYRRVRDATTLFSDYDKRFYPKVAKSWGNYFRRMTHYEGEIGPVNQLENIIRAIRNRQRLNSAAYTIVIQKPGWETVRARGGPCLNYIAVQAENLWEGERTIGMLAVYRNHDFRKRAYGNYWGLCNLLTFLAVEVGGTPGPLSSHAYVDGNKAALRALLERL